MFLRKQLRLTNNKLIDLVNEKEKIQKILNNWNAANIMHNNKEKITEEEFLANLKNFYILTANK